jgi:hypothetical protein
MDNLLNEMTQFTNTNNLVLSRPGININQYVFYHERKDQLTEDENKINEYNERKNTILNIINKDEGLIEIQPPGFNVARDSTALLYSIGKNIENYFNNNIRQIIKDKVETPHWNNFYNLEKYKFVYQKKDITGKLFDVKLEQIMSSLIFPTILNYTHYKLTPLNSYTYLSFMDPSQKTNLYKLIMYPNYTPYAYNIPECKCDYKVLKLDIIGKNVGTFLIKDRKFTMEITDVTNEFKLERRTGGGRLLERFKNKRTSKIVDITIFMYIELFGKKGL